MREVLTGTLIAADWVTRVNQDTLCEFLAPVKALNLPLLAILSDKQPSLVLALQKTWKDTPHQFCQAHYLTNAADQLYKVDQQMKTQLRKQVRANAGPTMREAQAKVQKRPTEKMVGSTCYYWVGGSTTGRIRCNKTISRIVRVRK